MIETPICVKCRHHVWRYDGIAGFGWAGRDLLECTAFDEGVDPITGEKIRVYCLDHNTLEASCQKFGAKEAR